MGLFSKAPICAVCNEECDFPKFQLANDEWLCQDCLSDAGLNKTANTKEMTAMQIKQLIYQRKNSFNSAEKMYHFAVDNGFGSGWNEKWGIKHFSVIEEHLLSDEKVLMTFIGLHNYKSASKHDGHFAYAITNKRIIMAQKQMISGEVFQTVYLENVNDITFSSGIIQGIMTIDTIKETFNVSLDKTSAKKIHEKVMRVLHDLKKEKDQPQVISEKNETSSADEILKFKKLMDEGIITTEEFSAKKKQLLGL